MHNYAPRPTTSTWRNEWFAMKGRQRIIRCLASDRTAWSRPAQLEELS